MGKYAEFRKVKRLMFTDKREKNPSETPEVAKPTRVFLQGFSTSLKGILCVSAEGNSIYCHYFSLLVATTTQYSSLGRSDAYGQICISPVSSVAP